MHDIDTWFLILSLIFPRVTLLIAYCIGCIPFNTIPFWGDFFMAIFLSRALILIYIITNLGFGGWAVIHLIFCACALLGTSSQMNTSKK